MLQSKEIILGPDNTSNELIICNAIQAFFLERVQCAEQRIKIIGLSYSYGDSMDCLPCPKQQTCFILCFNSITSQPNFSWIINISGKPKTGTGLKFLILVQYSINH